MIDENILTIHEAAEYLGLSRQAVFFALSRKKLQGEKRGRLWLTTKDACDNYKQIKYSREHSTFNGELIFDDSNLSVSQAAALLHVPPYHVYYLIKNGALHASRKGSAYVIKRDEIEDIIMQYTTGFSVSSFMAS